MAEQSLNERKSLCLILEGAPDYKPHLKAVPKGAAGEAPEAPGIRKR